MYQILGRVFHVFYFISVKKLRLGSGFALAQETPKQQHSQRGRYFSLSRSHAAEENSDGDTDRHGHVAVRLWALTLKSHSFRTSRSILLVCFNLLKTMVLGLRILQKQAGAGLGQGQWFVHPALARAGGEAAYLCRL